MLGDGIELKYLRFSKTGKSNIQKRITRRGWHTLRNMSRTYNYISTWNHTRELVQLTLDYDGEFESQIDLGDGYIYYPVLVKCIERDGGVYNEAYIPLCKIAKILNEEPGENGYFFPFYDSHLHIGKILNHRKAGICLWKDGKQISNVALIQYNEAGFDFEIK